MGKIFGWGTHNTPPSPWTAGTHTPRQDCTGPSPTEPGQEVPTPSPMWRDGETPLKTLPPPLTSTYVVGNNQNGQLTASISSKWHRYFFSQRSYPFCVCVCLNTFLTFPLSEHKCEYLTFVLIWLKNNIPLKLSAYPEQKDFFISSANL